MSIEMIDISHETIGRNVLLYPMLRQLRVSEIIDFYCPSYGEIAVGTIAETIILSRFSDKRVSERQHGDDLAPTKMDLRVGHRLGSTHYFNGLMDEVGIFEGALDENEIEKSMAGLKKFSSVESIGKLSTCWGAIKKSVRYH